MLTAVILSLVLEAKSVHSLEAAPAHKEIVKLTERGLEPQRVTLAERDSSVFFLNSTHDALASLNVNFGDKRAHCASANIKLDDSGTMRTVNAIGPKDFAIICFPDPGEYPVTVQGIDGTTKTYTGTVIVK